MRDGRKLLASGHEKVMIIPADSFHDMHSTVTIRKMSLTSILILLFALSKGYVEHIMGMEYD